MIVPGYEQYLEEAKAVRNHYNTKLEGLMSLYGLRHEGEVVTGCLVRVNTRLSGKIDEKFEVAQMIQASLSVLRAKTRHDFYEEFGGEDEVMEEFEDNGTFSDEILMKASAWYMATYGESDEEESATEIQVTASSSGLQGNQPRGEAGGQARLLSFPWVVDRILAKIKDAKQRERKEKGIQKRHALNAVGDLITVQAAYFFEKFQSDLTVDREMRIHERSKLQSILNRLLGVGRVPHLALYDSSLTGISVGDEERPRIEIYAHYKWDASDQEQYEFLHRLKTTLAHVGDVDIQRNPVALQFQRSQGIENKCMPTTRRSGVFHVCSLANVSQTWLARSLKFLPYVVYSVQPTHIKSCGVKKNIDKKKLIQGMFFFFHNNFPTMII